MAPRAYWTGNLKISLVTFGVRLYNAISEAEKVRLNQLHKGCNSRIKMPTTCPTLRTTCRICRRRSRKRNGLREGGRCHVDRLGWLMGLEPTTTGITILDSTN